MDTKSICESTPPVRTRPGAHTQTACELITSICTLEDAVLECTDRHGLDAALDLLFDVVGEALRRKHFHLVDIFLQTLEVERLSLDLLIGVLTITHRAQASLPSRPRAVERIARHFEVVALNRSERLVQGLL